VAQETIMLEYFKVSEIYRILGDYKKAYDNYVLYKAWSDSSYNVNDTKKQTELKLNYEFEQTQKKIREEALAKDILNKAELENDRKQRNYLLIGLAIISVMLIVTVKNYRAKQKANNILHKQKKEIEHQKKLVDAKNLEISDSINYALRIQTASIPTKAELSTYFKNHDLFFKPKDVVSGDFYWAERTKDFSLLGVGDCTGHGVPGAITSMIGSMLLNEIFNEKKIYQPNEVLTELNRLVKLTLRQDSESLTNDGMDIAFCSLNTTTNELLYAGANRPLYIINAKGELTEYKATKVSVGGQVPLIQQYELHHIQLVAGDTIVLSTDGYADQFGGAKEKKYTTKAFKNMLMKTSSLNANDQKNAIETAFNTWKGKHEQTDDILVFILKV
jgi:serine phosphatase RsbU (regulator of sigma subunit)